MVQMIDRIQQKDTRLVRQCRPAIHLYWSIHFDRLTQQRVDQFLQWFRELDAPDQDELMTLVYSEHKVRDVVRTFSSMPVDQRKAVHKLTPVKTLVIQKTVPCIFMSFSIFFNPGPGPK